ncbi:glycoside hydrolase family 97 protein [Aquisalinus flavus]|uniref:Alpha-glucosidase n=1 Tax=Aquisalinus flavus TaxID=1526572 RepID=A0A8J2V4I1_9PROT|nr:glycoside hydrolase family 97 protein [Aquisalinus flavus]MBD0426314.1 glycoside hydrolase family 97 catalytic domain-containing protein [Aquisalinus flavus]UNE48118.1 glycoside hydrolase family 97 protein [Aquisalinus flavus]GGD08940.1 alpha-glucosidase [Aquisalinus flavus]
MRLSAATALITFATTLAVPAMAEDWTVASPDGDLTITARHEAGEGVSYRVDYAGGDESRQAIGWSPLGFTLEATKGYERVETIADFSEGLSFVSVDESGGTDAYTMHTGKRLENEAGWNGLSLTFRDDETELLLRLDLRAYDEGVAFRYVLPEDDIFFHEVTREATGFNLGEDGTHWGAPYDFYTTYHPSYETFYTAQPTGTSTPESAGTAWGFPSLFEVNDLYVLIHESDVDGSYQGSHLATDAPGGVYTIAPPMAQEAEGFGKNTPSWTLPWEMPWRFAIVSDELADIAESNLVFHLAEPSKVEEDGFVEPGTATWSWLSDHGSPTDMAKLQKSIDLAADMGAEYTLVDANWNTMGNSAMEDLVAYADEKGVGLWFWYNSGGRHNIVSEQPRNIMSDPVKRRAEFAKLQRLGVRGVKVDFWQSDKQDMMAYYHALLADAAEFGIMTNFHGSTIPRGWERTWPHMMTKEAVRGAEFYSFEGQADYTAKAPAQNATHPFLRNVIGSMDYTPVHFSQFADNTRLTTNAHEAALAVVFESGVLHLSDSADAYAAIPQDWRDFLGSVPAAWDETKLLAGEIAEYAVVARRKGDVWYVGAINGTGEAMEIDLDLSDIAESGDALFTLSDDGEDGFGTEEGTLDSVTPTVALEPYGGLVMVLGE